MKDVSKSDKPTNLRPISYASKTLSSTESNYSNIEHELLGLLFAITHFKHFTFGRLVHVITDHKPLVSLFRKSLVDSSPGLTRMLMQLLDYTLDVRYQPGAQMHLSDAISRLLTHDQNTGKTIENLDISVHSIEELTGFNSHSVDKIHQHTSKDHTMQLLIQHINDGFPDSSIKCPETIHPYFSFRDELGICNGIILKGYNRIVIPESLRSQAINILHNKAHLGLSKTLERARTCMYWPGITDAIKDSISGCKVCLTFSDRQQREPYISDAQTSPWSHLSLDNFEFRGQYFLMILDISTKFFVVRPVSSLNTYCTIQTLTAVFSEHGMPTHIQCDRGRNFVSDLFQQYCQHLGINLTFSSAYHHGGNPAERAIRTVKLLMKHCTMAKQSLRLALVEYLATPLDSNTPSPPELNGHKFNSLLPNISTFSSRHSDTLVSCHDAQLQHNKRGHTLPELPVGSKVGYRNHTTNQFNVGIISARNSRSYTIRTESGTNISRNCIDLKQTNAPFESQPVVSKFAKSQHAPSLNTVPSSTNAYIQHSGKAKLIGKRVEASSNKSNMYTTCSGCMSKQTARLIASM